MDTQTTKTNSATTNNDSNHLSQAAITKIPEHVFAWLYSAEITENVGIIANKFNIAKSRVTLLAKITGQIILKKIKLDYLPTALQQNLQIDAETARQMTIDVAIKQLLPVRSHLAGVENFITGLGGILPETLPTEAKTTLRTETPPLMPAPTPQTIKKPFRQAVHENKEILNQQLTAQPIKIPDFDQPVRPTIKNWLSDYIRQKGTGHHDELERGDYLYRSPNAQNLPTEDRLKLAAILRAYDEDIEMPISPETNLIIIENLLKKEAPLKTPAPSTLSSSFQGSAENQTRQVPPSLPPSTPPIAPMPAPTPKPTVPPTTPAPDYSRLAPPGNTDNYREPIEEEDLAGPLKPPSPVRPAPRLDGNIVDLKDFDNRQQ